MQDVLALPHLATELLPKHIGDIHLVVDSQDADAHAVSLATERRGSQTVNSVKSPT